MAQFTATFEHNKTSLYCFFFFALIIPLYLWQLRLRLLADYVELIIEMGNFFFAETQSTMINGYVKPLLVTHVPGWGGPNMGGQTPSESSIHGVGGGSQGPGGSYPATPQTIFQAHSPDPSITRDTPSVASRSVSWI